VAGGLKPMNADILKRIVRAIVDGSQRDLERLAQKVVESERRTGHTNHDL
jgi:uncharacterized protein Yka (UPF0111/DUF47 family)